MRLYAGLAMTVELYYNPSGMTMFFPYFELAASLFVLLFSYHIWTRHHENRAARFFSRFATVAFLACIFTYSFRIAFTLEIAQDINRLAVTLIAFSFSIFAHFALIFTHKETFLRKPFALPILYLPPALIGILFCCTNAMYLRHEIFNYGIASIPAPAYWLFILTSMAYAVWGFSLFLSYAKTAPQKIEKEQALLIAFGSLIPVVIGLIFDEILPVVFQMRLIPPTVVFDFAFMTFFIYLAMRKYSLFAISPALAADVIIEAMPDSLLITDLDGQIIFINEEARKFFHASEETVAGKCIANLFKDKAKYKQLYDEVVEKKLVVELFQAELVDPLGERIPALINARLLREKFVGSAMGIVFIVRDIRG
jgi:PAS domain S-box-containing protein